MLYFNKHYAIETGDSLFLVPWWPLSPKPDFWENCPALSYVKSISASLQNEQKWTAHIYTKLEYVCNKFCALILPLETGTPVVAWYWCLQSSVSFWNGLYTQHEQMTLMIRLQIVVLKETMSFLACLFLCIACMAINCI